MCKWRARTRILRIGICRSEQKRSCGAKSADHPEKGHQNLLREDDSVWHSTSMCSVRGIRSDYRKPDGSYRARGAEIIISGRPRSPKVARCPARQRRKGYFVFAFQLISPRSRAPTFSIGCFSLSATSYTERLPPVLFS